MRERVKIFTHSSGEGSTVSEDALQETINDWLAEQEGEITRVTQSECHHPGKAQHVTVSIWYVAAK